jgi:hypothetical protein
MATTFRHAWQSAGYRGLEQAPELGFGPGSPAELRDLVQLRSFPDGAAVRVHMYLP